MRALLTLEAGAMLAALTAVTAVLVKSWPKLRRLNHFVDDLIGEDERPGVPRRPGVIERLAAQEERGRYNAQILKALLQEMHPNGGSTIRDALNRIETQVAKTAGELQAHVEDADRREAAVRALIDKGE